MQAKGHVTEEEFAELEVPTLTLTFKSKVFELSNYPFGIFNGEKVYEVRKITLRAHYREQVYASASMFDASPGGRKLRRDDKSFLTLPEVFAPQLEREGKTINVDSFYSIINELRDLVEKHGAKKKSAFKECLGRLIVAVPGTETISVSSYGFEKDAAISIYLSSLYGPEKQVNTSRDDYTRLKEAADAFIRKTCAEKKRERDEEEEKEKENDTKHQKTV